MKQKIVYYVLFIFLFVLTSYSTTTFSKYTQDINKQLTLNVSQPKYTISFNKNSTTATGSKEPVSCVYGTNCVLGQNTFTNNGYTFAGWNTKADGSGTTYTTSALNLTAINGNTVTLFAIWSADAYSISYDLKGGSVSSNPTTYNIETPTFSLNNPTRSGYTFAGWTGSNGSTPQGTVTITKGSTGDKSYVANWNKSASSLTITLSQATYTYDKTAKTPTVTVKDGSTTLVEGVDYDVTYSNNINAGTANVTITMKNTENANHDATYVGSTTKNFTINKKTVTVTAENKTMNYGDNAPTYTSTISGVISGDTAYTGSVSYTVKNSGNTTVTIGTTSPVGTYSVIPGGLTANINYTITYTAGTLTISKVTPTISLTAKANLTYNGSSQAANNATVTLKNNESYAGTITYTYYSNSSCTTKVTTSNSGASAAGGVPKNAGNWYVQATTSAFGNYNAGASSCVAHTISTRNITFKAKDQSKTYDGTALNADSTCEVTSGSLVSGHTATCANTGSQTAVGSSTKTISTVTIKDSGNTDVTANYNITKTNGTLTVSEAALSGGSVTISGNNVVGEVLTANVTNTSPNATYTYQWYRGSTPISGATSSTYTPVAADVGNTLKVVVTATKTGYTTKSFEDSTDATDNKTSTTKTKVTVPTVANYCVAGLTYDGTEKTLVSAAATGFSWTASQTKRTFAGSQNVTATLSTNYIWNDYSTEAKTISCSIGTRSITYKASNQSKTYDGTALSANSTCEVTSGTLVSGHTATCTNTGSQTAVGSSTKTLSSVVIKDSSNNDVSSNYNITKTNGTLTVTAATPTINLTAKTGLIYNGSAQAANNATVSLKNNESYTGTITYTYYSNSSCTTKVTTSNSGASAAGGVPKNAGNWYVQATTSAFGNYSAGASSCVAHTINKKSVTVTADNKSRTYGDTSTQTYSYSVSGAVGSESAVSGTATYTVKNSGGTAVTVNSSLAAGTYTITPSGLTAGENYTITYANGTLTVNKATPTISLSAKTGMVYNGSSQAANTATVTLKNSESYSGTITYTYYSDSSCSTQVTTSNSGASTTGGVPKNAGNWYVKATTAAFGNYNAGASSCVAHTISKKTVTVTVDNKSRTYGDTATQSYSYTLSGAIGSETAVSGTASYTVKNSGGTAVTVNSSLAVGTYTITPSGLTAGGNYTITYVNGTLTVNKATPTINLTAKTGMTYNGLAKSSNAATVTLKNGESYSGTITYTYYSNSACTTQVTTSNSGAASAGGMPVYAGNWYVKATTSAFGNYSAGASSCVAHTINKKSVTVTADNKSRTYGDTATQTYSYSVSGAIGSESAVSGTATYTVKNSGGTAVTVNSSLAAGTYTITPSGLTAGGNYTITYANGTLTVNKATPTISLSAKTGMVYNGNAQAANTATVTLKNSESYSGTITYTYYSDSSCSTQVTTSNSGASTTGGVPKNAGNWYVKATTAAFGNYNAGASSCVAHTISKKTVTVTADNKSRTYGDTATQTYSYTLSGAIGSETAVSGTASYTVKNSGGTTLIVNQILPQGTYTIIPSGLTAAANYTITYVNGTLTVNKATPTISLTAKTGMTYNGLAKSSNAATVTLKNGESYSGTITYTYYSNSACTTQVTTSNSGAASAGGIPVYAGNWYVKATTAAFGNYNAGASSCVAHTIAKATPVISVSDVVTYTIPYDTSFTEKANVPGKFTNVSSNTNIATVSPSTSPNEIPANTNTTVNVHRVGGGTATFTVTFTPTDTTNYNSITQSSSGKQTFDITFRNKLIINIKKDNSLWTNVNSFYVKVGNSGGAGVESGVTGTYEFASMPVGSGILYASYLGFDELVNTGQTINNVETSGAYPDITTTLNYYTLTVNAGTCSKATGSGIYLSNQNPTISASPAQGYHFTSWTVSSGGNAPASTTSETTTVSTSKTTTLTANCVKNPNYKLTLLYNHTQDKDFEYLGDYDHYVIPETMVYKFEAWGAQGGPSVYNGSIQTTYVGGKGAYTSGYLNLTEGSEVFVYVGQHPSSKSGGKSDHAGGWNGGGLGRRDKNDDESAGAGGGATDFRIFSTFITNFDLLAWNNPFSLRHRVMVAAGGAGNNYTGSAALAGGGLSSTQGSRPPATQTTGYAFGIGQDGRDTTSRTGNGGGGGGYWGGYGGWQSGTGTTGWTNETAGSSFISGYTGAVAVASSEVNTPRYASDGVTLCSDGTTDNVCSHHFTGNIFTDDPYTGDPMKIIDGNSEMPAHDEDEDITTTIGNAGHGYARISVYSYQKEVTNGDEVGYIPAPMLEEGEPLIVDGEPVLDEDGEPVVIGAQEINWLDEGGNPVYEHSIYELNRDSTWHADGFRPKEYKITYNLNGGTANNPTHYNEETETFTLERPTREGYRFDGWTGSNGDTPQKDVTIEEGSAGSKEYVANWTAGSTLTINTNGGVYTGENPRVEPSGTSISVPAPKLVGRRFTGWTIKNSYGGNAYGTITNNEPLTSPQTYIYGNGNDTITANWVDRDDITITFNAMGGTPVTSQVGSYGDMWARYVTTTREGYIFDGWYDKEIGGNRVCSKSCGGTFTDDETWYAHWIGGTAKVEYDYNINQTFGTASMLDTYVRPDWTKDYDFDIKFTPGTSGKRYLLLGNYDASSANALNIEITTANQIRVYVGTGSINTSFGTVAIGQENILHLHWNASTKQMTGELSGAGSGTYTGTLNGLTGVASRNLRTGTLDYRQGTTNVFTSINISGLVISQYYESPLAEEITVPDPASYYLLFDGWTGANGDTPEYNLTVPLNSYGTITYIANWSPGPAPKTYKSGNYSTSNSYIKFYYNVGVPYVDQARRKAYTYERVYFYRTNTGYTTYGTGSMTIKYNGTAYTKSLTESQKITNSGVSLWSRYWNARSNTFDTVSYPDSGKKSVVIGISKFSHQRFSISGLPKNYTVTLPAIKAIE